MISTKCGHDCYIEKQPCSGCIDKNKVIFSMVNKIAKINQEKSDLKEGINELCKEVMI